MVVGGEGSGGQGLVYVRGREPSSWVTRCLEGLMYCIALRASFGLRHALYHPYQQHTLAKGNATKFSQNWKRTLMAPTTLRLVDTKITFLRSVKAVEEEINSRVPRIKSGTSSNVPTRPRLLVLLSIEIPSLAQ